jgi:hypothetical protein
VPPHLAEPQSLTTAAEKQDKKMTMNFDEIIAPYRQRTKKEIAHDIIDIPSKDDHNLYKFAALLTEHQISDTKHNVLRRIAHHLGKSGDLHKLRLLSKHIAHTASSNNILNGSFKRLFITPMYANPERKRDKAAFTNIAYGCSELVVTMKERVDNYKFPPGMVFQGNQLHGRDSTQINDWRHVFQLCPNLTTLMITTGSCNTGTMWNRTSTALTALRTAFEEAELSKMTTLRTVPADMVYISLLKWHGPSLGGASPITVASWSRITNLELQILPMLELTKVDRIQTVKMFNAWLRALSPQLQSLRLCYLGRDEGEHPLALMKSLDIKSRGQPNMRMPVLKELWARKSTRC